MLVDPSRTMDISRESDSMTLASRPHVLTTSSKLKLDYLDHSTTGIGILYFGLETVT